MADASLTLDAHEAHLASMAIETELEFLKRPRPGVEIDGLANLIAGQEALRQRLLEIVPKLQIDPQLELGQ